MNINCVICSDLFVSADSIFTTPCGHIFHHVCLLQWMERSKSCPQCRNKCTERNIFRIYFNNMVNLDSTQNTVNLLESVDNLTLQIREKDQALKEARDERLKLEETLQTKKKRIEKLDASVSRSDQIIATMRHELDIFSSHRASYKIIETENTELKSKLGLMVSIESVLTASQHEVDEILKQNINAKDLAVMVGTLKRELNNNMVLKNDLRKQLQLLKSDLRVEQEKRRKLQEELSSYESENHTLKKKLSKRDNYYEMEEKVEAVDWTVDSPERIKRPRLVPKCFNELNTSSPMTQDDLQKRVAQVKESDSPYLQVKTSSIPLACAFKKSIQMRETQARDRGIAKLKSDVPQLSIFNNPRVPTSGPTAALKSGNVVYNGIGGTTKVLQSDLKADTFLPHQFKTSKTMNGVKKKKLSPNAFHKQN